MSSRISIRAPCCGSGSGCAPSPPAGSPKTPAPALSAANADSSKTSTIPAGDTPPSAGCTCSTRAFSPSSRPTDSTPSSPPISARGANDTASPGYSSPVRSGRISARPGSMCRPTATPPGGSAIPATPSPSPPPPCSPPPNNACTRLPDIGPRISDLGPRTLDLAPPSPVPGLLSPASCLLSKSCRREDPPANSSAFRLSECPGPALSRPYWCGGPPNGPTTGSMPGTRGFCVPSACRFPAC
jgi:hypothetical protein